MSASKQKKINTIINKMTLDQKISFLCGKNFWQTKDFPELGIPLIEVADGPYGVRKQTGIPDHMGWNKSLPATAYPSGPSVAASWDESLVRELGEYLGAEARSFGIDILLGPAVNIVRTPLCGRNFEYYSEDPYLTGKTASAYINGLKNQNVGACVKHFAVNNQETEREYINAEVDERTLREIYLAAFEETVKSATPASVMAALNKVNGYYCSENETLLTEILRDEWGFSGIVMSDWFGVNDRAAAVAAGLDLEMPVSGESSAERIRNELKNGTITEEDIDACVYRLISVALKADELRQKNVEDLSLSYHEFAQKLAEQSIVLLKNSGGVLPLPAKAKVAVIGEFAQKPQFQMEGSALVNPTRTDIPLEEMLKINKNISFSKGYSLNGNADTDIISDAVNTAKNADYTVIYAGLPTGIEAEGRDRTNLCLPQNQNELINEIVKVQRNVIVVLMSGSPVEMPWVDSVNGIVATFLGGQAVGSAIARILFGEVNPSGKLPVTFPANLNNTPSYLNFPGEHGVVSYKESVFVGYRYYITKNIKPLFPFGHGLSYTNFEYEEIILSSVNISDADTLTVCVTVKNVGVCDGAEVVQLYVSPPKNDILRPDLELRGYNKIFLKKGETGSVRFTLSKRSFSYYDTDLKDWYVPEGPYGVLIGASCEDIRLTAKVNVKPKRPKYKEITGWSSIYDLTLSQKGQAALNKLRAVAKENDIKPLLNSSLFSDDDEKLKSLSLRVVTITSGGIINNDMIDALVSECNNYKDF